MVKTIPKLAKKQAVDSQKIGMVIWKNLREVRRKMCKLRSVRSMVTHCSHSRVTRPQPPKMPRKGLNQLSSLIYSGQWNFEQIKKLILLPEQKIVDGHPSR
jgi:hypothetical protein